MKNIFISVLFLCFISSATLKAQNVGISNSATAPAASAMLDIVSTDKGLLVPRFALSDITVAAPVVAPALSLIVYNTATAGASPNNVLPGFYYWDGAKWVAFSGSGGREWALLGNAGTVAGTNFLGTTDAQALVFKTNNVERSRILSSGEFVVGSTTANTGDVFSSYGTYPISGYASGNNSIAGYFNGGAGTSARGVAATSGSANGFGVVASNSNATGTGMIASGNALGGTYLTGGSGGAFVGTNFGIYGTATSATGAGVFGRNGGAGVYGNNSNLASAGVGYGYAMNLAYAGTFGQSEVNVNANTDLYHFGTEGFMYITGGVITRHRRAGGILGMCNITSGGNPVWGSLAYNNSTGNTYGLYYTTAGGTANGTGRMASSSNTSDQRSAIGMGGYGDLMGGWIRGNLYGLEVKGERYSLYVDGKAYTNDVITQLTENGTEQKSVSYVSTSTKVDLTDRGMAKLVNGEAIVTFSEDFALAISSSELPLVSITPYGETKGVYVSQVNNNSFRVKENGGGTSNVNFVWNVTATRKGYETVEHPKELLDKDYDNNMNDVMYHEGKNGSAKPIWWDGTTLRFEELQGNGNLKLETIDTKKVEQTKEVKANEIQKVSKSQNQ